MQFQKGAEVKSADDKSVGHVDRVVMDPKSKEVTHLILRKGVLLTKDSVLPINLVSTSTEKQINLTVSSKEVKDLPEYQEKSYVPTEEGDLPKGAAYTPSFYWYPMSPSMYPSALVEPVPEFEVRVERNIPDENVALKAGARVVGSDGEEAGHIDQVFTQSSSDQVTSFVVSRGLLVKEHRLVPINWVKFITDEEVQLNVPAAKVDSLQTFEPTHH
jgi:uncharacterized protein YrrD